MQYPRAQCSKNHKLGIGFSGSQGEDEGVISCIISKYLLRVYKVNTHKINIY